MNAPKGKGAWMAKVGEKGQIVIPKEAREMFGIAPGDTLLILGDIEQGLAILSGDKVATLAASIFGGKPEGREGEDHDRDSND